MPQISVEIENEVALGMPDATRDHLYRICQESLTNAVKHAQAKHVDIRLVVTASHLVLTIRDDGVGLPQIMKRPTGLGLSSMRHRAAAIGARLYVRRPDDRGTEVRVECPAGAPASENVDTSANGRRARANTDASMDSKRQ